MKKDTWTLIGVVVLIVISIVYLQSTQSHFSGTVEAQALAKMSDSERIQEKAKQFKPAVEIVDPAGYINTDFVDIKSNIGKKVILVDFWTYSCVNCQRTIPYLKQWWDTYEDEGLLIIGVHSPEFEFEKDRDNVIQATQKLGVTWPVVQDNDFSTFRAYENRYWPRKYLIDIDGFIVYDHIGEGGYEETEKKIQELLAERAQVLEEEVELTKDLAVVDNEAQTSKKTPERYFGSKLYRGGFAQEFVKNEPFVYERPDELAIDEYALVGEWIQTQDYVELVSDTGSVLLHYQGKEAGMVAGRDTSVDVLLDGKKYKTIDIGEETLYYLVDEETYSTGVLEIQATKGFRIFTFVFG